MTVCDQALLMEDEERFTRHLRDSSNSSRRTCSHVVKTVSAVSSLIFDNNIHCALLTDWHLLQVLADLLRLRQSDRIVFTDIDCGGLITPLRPMVVSVG